MSYLTFLRRQNVQLRGDVYCLLQLLASTTTTTTTAKAPATTAITSVSAVSSSLFGELLVLNSDVKFIPKTLVSCS